MKVAGPDTLCESMREFPVRELHPRIQQGKRVDERTRTADPESHYELVATCSRRWLGLEIRLPKLFALASIYPPESAPPQSHSKPFLKFLRTGLPRPS